jgi:DNA-directed RNA polymerase subunit RPC12/RpoP
LLKRWAVRPTRNGVMIIFSAVKLKELFEKERNYPWQKPDNCPYCNSHRLWGHGFADALFDGYQRPLLLKLYRCPDCGCVIRLRPAGYFKRFQAPVETIRSSIACKSTTNRWLSGISRSRQLHWFNALCKRIKVYLTDTWRQDVVVGFDYLLQLGQTPVSRCI